MGFDRREDLLLEADFLDILDVGVFEKKQHVSEDEVRLLRSLFAFHLGESMRLGDGRSHTHTQNSESK